MRFTNRTGLENLTNQAVHDLVEERKKKPLELEESNEISQEQSNVEGSKDIKASFTYGTNSANSETNRMLFNGSYHTFSTNSSNQMQCTCCPEPILMNAPDAKEESRNDYLTSSTTAGTKSDYLFSKPRKSSYTF